MVFCYYAHNSVWTCELGYGADTMFHRTYFLFILLLPATFVQSFIVEYRSKFHTNYFIADVPHNTIAYHLFIKLALGYMPKCIVRHSKVYNIDLCKECPEVFLGHSYVLFHSLICETMQTYQ